MTFITTMPSPPKSYMRDYLTDLCMNKANKVAKAKKTDGVWTSFKSFWKTNHKIRITRVLKNF